MKGIPPLPTRRGLPRRSGTVRCVHSGKTAMETIGAPCNTERNSTKSRASMKNEPISYTRPVRSPGGSSAGFHGTASRIALTPSQPFPRSLGGATFRTTSMSRKSSVCSNGTILRFSAISVSPLRRRPKNSETRYPVVKMLEAAPHSSSRLRASRDCNSREAISKPFLPACLARHTSPATMAKRDVS